MELVKIFNVQRKEKSAIRVFFRHWNNDEYCMDMSKKLPNGPCTVTFWHCHPENGNCTYMQQLTGNHMSPSVTSARRCIEEFLKNKDGENQ